MRKKILILLLLLLGSISSIAQNYENRLYPFSEDGKLCCYVNIFGERITESIYDDDGGHVILEDSENCLVRVKKNGMYGIIDAYGREIVPCQYQELHAIYINGNASDYLACQKNDKYGIIKMDNSIIVSFIYDYITTTLLDNDIIMCCKNGKWGAINGYTGKNVIPFVYDDYEGCFETNLLTVCKEGKHGCINTHGDIVIPLIITEGWDFRDDGHMVCKNLSNNNWYCYNKKGKKIEIGKYDDVGPSFENRILVRKNGKYGFINSENGKIVIPCIYNNAYHFHEGVALVSNNGPGYAMISESGTLLTDFILSNSHSDGFIHNGLFIGTCITNCKYGVVDKFGKIVIPFEYDGLYSFNKNGYFAFKKGDKWGVANEHNSIMIPAIYDHIWLSDDCDLVAVKKEGKWGYVNLSNQIIVPFSYDDADAFRGNFASVYKNGKRGYIDCKGNMIVSCGEINDELKKCQYLYSQISSDIDNNIPLSNIINNNTFAIIISNEKYFDENIPAVNYSISDGKSFKEYCSRTLGIPSKNIKFISNATLNQMRSGVNWVCNNATALDGEASVMFYYSGHGIPNEKNGNTYLLPSDGDANDYRSAIGLDELYKQLGELKTKQTTVFLDACFSGSSKDGTMMLADSRGVAIKQKPTQPKGNVIVLSAAQGDETAYPYKKKKHGMFTYFLLKKLQETKGDVSLGELSQYINERVCQQSIVETGKVQTPSVSVSSSFNDLWKNIKLK